MRPPLLSVRSPLLSSVFRPAAWSGVLVFALMTPARPESVPELRTERMIGPGARCTTLIRPAGPWVIHVFSADGENGLVRPGPTFASERGLRAAAVSDQARRATTDARYPIAGV